MAKWNPKYQVNLLRVFDRAYSGDSKELRSKLRPLLSNGELKSLFSNFVIDEIVERTTSGIDKNGESMGGYSKEYKESLSFKVWKGGQSRVNLEQTGDMLSDINSEKGRFNITFSFNSDHNKAKAQGHISGEYGETGRTSPRDFFGLPEEEEETALRSALKVYSSSNLSIEADIFDFSDIVI